MAGGGPGCRAGNVQQGITLSSEKCYKLKPLRCIRFDDGAAV
jgi:hypothetical protein